MLSILDPILVLWRPQAGVAWAGWCGVAWAGLLFCSALIPEPERAWAAGRQKIL